MTRWSGAPLEVAVVVMVPANILFFFFHWIVFFSTQKQITALHTKGKTFPWPLVILDGLILAQRAGDLFAFCARIHARVCVCVRVDIRFPVRECI